MVVKSKNKRRIKRRKRLGESCADFRTMLFKLTSQWDEMFLKDKRKFRKKK